MFLIKPYESIQNDHQNPREFCSILSVNPTASYIHICTCHWQQKQNLIHHNRESLMNMDHTAIMTDLLVVELFWGNTKNIFIFPIIYETAQVVIITPHGRQGPVCFVLSIPWLLMAWRLQEPGHQQPWYCPSSASMFCPQHHKGSYVSGAVCHSNKCIIDQRIGLVSYTFVVWSSLDEMSIIKQKNPHFGMNMCENYHMFHDTLLLNYVAWTTSTYKTIPVYIWYKWSHHCCYDKVFFTPSNMCTWLFLTVFHKWIWSYCEMLWYYMILHITLQWQILMG